jgi:hypothetical protein
MRMTAWRAAPGDCTPQGIHQIVERFIEAFNRGDLARLDQLVDADAFGWYSTDAPGQRFDPEARDRSTLMAYFAARHRQHERLVLKSVNISFADLGEGGFSFRLTRSADDGLPPTSYDGKGQVRCALQPGSLSHWAMDRSPWWPPYDLLPEVVGLILVAATIGTIILWRQRKARSIRITLRWRPHRVRVDRV